MKKRFCRAISLTIAVLLLFSLVSFAAENGEPVLQTSQVSFLDAGGNTLSQLAANSQITARLTAKGTAGRSVKASLILAYYEYGFLKGLKSFDTTVSSGKETSMEVSVTTGNKPEKGKLKAFLWESYEGNTILSKSAEFGSKDASVSNILLDGVPLEGFSPERTSYQAVLPASSLDYPEICAVTGDLAADVQITKGAFPSDVEIRVISSDKSAQKSYRIAFSRQEAAVSNVTLHYTAGAKDITASAVIPNAANPVFIKSPNGATEGIEYFGIDNLKSHTKCVYDRNTYLINLPDYLLGSTVIAGSQSETGNADQKTQIKDKTNKKLMTFDLNASADVYYMIVTKGTEGSLLNYAPWLSEYGFEYVENLPNWVEGAQALPKIRDGSVFKKSVTVENGGTQKVTLGGNEMLFTTPIVFVVWKTGEDIAQLKEITVDGVPLDGFSPDVTEYEYTLSSASQEMPEIGASPVTENARVVISREEANRRVTIQVTSANGKQTAEYTIQFHEFQPTVSNITMYGDGGVSKDITADAYLKNIQEPVFKAGTPSDAGYYDYANVSACTKMIYDRNTYLINIPPQWTGGTIIAGSQSDAKSGAYSSPSKTGTNSRVLSFTIDNSAHIYYIYPGNQNSFANVKWAEDEGYELTNITSGWVEGGNAGAQPKNNMTVFQKTIEVESGTTKTVNIGGAGGTFTSPIVVLQWFYPKKEAELKEIRINGVPFADFSTDTLTYTQPFPEGDGGMPEVTAEATLEGAAVEVATEGTTAVITVTSADGTVSKTYRITFAVTPAVTNVQMHFGDQTKAVTAIDTNIQEPVFHNPALTGTDLYTYTNVKSKTRLIGDRETYLMDIPENLLGQTIISGSQTDAGANSAYVKDGSNGNLMTFDVNCSANVYYFLYATSASYTNIAWAETAGFTPADLSVKWVEGKSASPAPKTNLILYKKTVEVPPGQTATVSIGGQTGTFACPSVIIEWIQ